MQNWERNMYFEDSKLRWLLPSPNIGRTECTLTFPATILFEGTGLSEGRGTAQPLEIVGHTKLEPFSFCENHLSNVIKKSKLEGIKLRPMWLLQTFYKQTDKICFSFQVHVTDKSKFKPWQVG